MPAGSARQDTPENHVVMGRDRENKTGRPTTELAGALFMLAWAIAGWLSMALNRQLSEFDPGPLDPGPLWMPTIVLLLLTVGAIVLGIAGLLPAGSVSTAAEDEDRPPAHGRPAAFLCSLLVYVLLMPLTGFAAATALFAFIWIILLSPGRRTKPAQTVAIAATAAAVITTIIYLGFVVAIRAPLP